MNQDEAIARLHRCLQALKELPCSSSLDAKYKKWSRDTKVALKHIFGPDSSQLAEFIEIYFMPRSFNRSNPSAAYARSFQNGRETAEALFVSMIEEVEEFGLSTRPKRVVAPGLPSSDNSRVFVVHGHDEAAREKVARLLEQVGLSPIILHEQPNMSRTIIEKLEEHSNVGFAVVILTKDDLVAGEDAPGQEHSYRARQNVILELGRFMGLLGRERVCTLYQNGVELPSDFSGVLYTLLDADGAWRLKLLQELKVAGFDVDLNQLIP